MKIFCPICGSEMSFNGKVYNCINGNMPLSQRMNDILIQRFSFGCYPRVSDEKIQTSDSWYCPGCGIPLNKDYSCSLCSKKIIDLRYELVEFHPHK